MTTKNRIKNVLETLVNQIEENGLMQYDRIHNGEHWALEDAKELLKELSDDEEESNGRGISEPKFTPGPWKAHHGCMEPDYVFYGEEENCDAEKRVIAEVYQRPEPYRNYDVDLIAAAPEMYEALEKIQEIELSIAQEYRVNADDSQIYNIAEKVLRKARGESEDEE